MNQFKSFGFIAFLFLLVLGYSSFYTVDESKIGLLFRLGKMERVKGTNEVAVKSPGLHFKLPIIDKAQVFDARIQTLDIESSRIVTAEKKDVLVDYYAKWKISDAGLYYTRVGGNLMQARTLLQQTFNDGLRAEFGKRTISDLVSGERINIMKILTEQANESAQRLGIEVVDVRIKRIDLPSEVSAAVFDRMRAERQRIATEHRSEGKSQAEALRAQADATVTVIKATALSDAKRIRGEGDAEAARISADAYNQNADFYSFYRSLTAYEDSFKDKNDVLVLTPDSQFFKYFKSTNKSS